MQIEYKLCLEILHSFLLKYTRGDVELKLESINGWEGGLWWPEGCGRKARVYPLKGKESRKVKESLKSQDFNQILRRF